MVKAKVDTDVVCTDCGRVIYKGNDVNIAYRSTGPTYLCDVCNRVEKQKIAKAVGMVTGEFKC